MKKFINNFCKIFLIFNFSELKSNINFSINEYLYYSQQNFNIISFLLQLQSNYIQQYKKNFVHQNSIEFQNETNLLKQKRKIKSNELDSLDTNLLNKSISETSNEKIIRTVKNKKIVYCQSDFNFSPITNKQLSKFNEKNEKKKEENIDEKFRGLRGSKFRGVSKNGNQWQVLIMINKKKRYIGNYKSEKDAARAYDIVAIQNHGKKAKTNFYYTSFEIEKIKNMYTNHNYK